MRRRERVTADPVVSARHGNLVDTSALGGH